MANFQPARAKLTIGSLDNPSLTVKADYNPKELQISKQLAWKPHNEQDRNVLAGKRASKGEQDSIEVTGAPTRSMSIEMLFDGYETGSSVERQIAVLDELSSPQLQSAQKSKDRRPHYCVVVWGQGGIPAFRCVVEQLVVKYTMFDTDGRPLRAVCTVTLKEASIKVLTDLDLAEKAVLARSTYDGSRAIRMLPPNAPPRPPTKQPAPVTARPRPASARPASPTTRATPTPPASPRTPAAVRAPVAPSAAGQAEAMEMFREVNDGPRAPSAAGQAEAMDMFREVNGPTAPSAAGQAEAMEMFREVNGDGPIAPVPGADKAKPAL